MHGFRSISLPSSGDFSPFPHGTSSLSVTGEYLALDSGLPGFPQDSKCPVVLRNALAAFADFAYRSCTFYAPAFNLRSAINSGPLYCAPYNPRRTEVRQVWAVPISLALLWESLLISLPPGTKIFQFPGFAPFGDPYGPGSPIRKSPGQSLSGSSPRLIAATLRPSSPSNAKASTVHP